MEKKCLYLIFLTVGLILFCFGCVWQEEAEDEVTISPEDEICFNLVQTETSEENLLTFLQEKPTVSELDQKFPIECFRRVAVPVMEKLEELIWATYQTDKGWILVYFYDNFKYSGAYRTTQMESKTDDLKQVEIGMSVDEVEALDPMGDYWFKSSNKPPISYHYTEDGTEYYIVYDGYFNVTKVICFPI